MGKRMAVFAALAGTLVALSEARAASETCEYHADCDAGEVCLHGTCRASDEVADQFEGTEECGDDRRCRIRRMKQENRERRVAQMRRQREFARQQAEQLEEDQIEAYPRIERPFSAEWRISRLGAIGLSTGYTFFGRLRPELQVVLSQQYDVIVQYQDQNFSGTQSLSWVMPGVVYFFTDGEFAPYAGVSFAYGWGEDASTRGAIVGSGGVAEVESVYHAGELKAGLDYQMAGEGAHLRLGLAYRPLIYNQARVAPGTYAESRRGALKNWFEQLARFDVMFLAGWAF